MIIRIAGTNIPVEKRIEISLTYIFGIGRSLSLKILKELKIDENKRAKDLKETEINKIRETVEKNYTVESELRREVRGNIKRLVDIGCYRGDRHAKKLPTRGQCTRINAKTSRRRRGI